MKQVKSIPEIQKDLFQSIFTSDAGQLDPFLHQMVVKNWNYILILIVTDFMSEIEPAYFIVIVDFSISESYGLYRESERYF